MNEIGSIIRPARPNEAQAMSELAIRSKAYWGYSKEFMVACKSELTYFPEQISDGRFTFSVADIKGTIVGFSVLEALPQEKFELDALFIEPKLIGSGLGRRLFEYTKASVVGLGGRSLMIQSDPNAERFYTSVGATVTGQSESGSIPGRFLPVMTVYL